MNAVTPIENATKALAQLSDAEWMQVKRAENLRRAGPAAAMSATIIAAREKFLRRQIERAYEIADHYDELNDPTSASVFEYWARNAEDRLEQLAERNKVEDFDDPEPA